MGFGVEMSIGHKLARCLAKVPQTPWEKVERQLFSKCPQPSDGGGASGTYILSSKNQDAVLSLGLYFLESGFLHCEKILDYLLGLTRALASASFPDEIPAEKSSRLPPAEIFSFSLNTLLNDVATHNPHLSDKIFDVQLELMSGILAQLQEMKKHEVPSPFNTRKYTCKCMVPVLLGLCRAMGRFAPPSQDFLLCKIYPRSPPGCAGVGRLGPGQGEPDPNEKIKGYSNFR